LTACKDRHSGSPCVDIHRWTRFHWTPFHLDSVPSVVGIARVSIVMQRSFLLGASALISGVIAFQAPANAAGTPAQKVAIRELELSPGRTFEPTRLTPPMMLASAASVSRGQASWYGPGFYGNRTASGETFRPGTMTAAHRTLPFGTMVRVTNLSNGRSTVVRINDRGPFHGGRVIDLAHGAAVQLGVTASGTAPVSLEILR
jgi:rare lipoprotein A